MQKRIVGDSFLVFEHHTISDMFGTVANIYIRTVDKDCDSDGEIHEHVIEQAGQMLKSDFSITIDVDLSRDFEVSPVQGKQVARELEEVLSNFEERYQIEWNQQVVADLMDIIQSRVTARRAVGEIYSTQVAIADETLHIEAVMRLAYEDLTVAVAEIVPMIEYKVGIDTKPGDMDFVTLDRTFIHNALRFQLSEVVNLQQLYGNPGSCILFYEYGLQQLYYQLASVMDDEVTFVTVDVDLFLCSDLWILRGGRKNQPSIILGQLQLP